MMTYTEAIEYIHSVSNFFCKPCLERIKELCSELGNPEKSLKFIHIGGTNGKGSVSSMLNSVLCEGGYKVGLYTSPYVREFNERMRVNGKNIPNDTLARLTERVKKVAEKMADSPTEFELITAIAFEYFKEEKCNIVILEVGMGGRLDATNIIDKPALSIITGIALDHTAFLGDTVEKIAYEKAGIIKENSVALWGGDNKAAETVIEEECIKKQSILCKTDYSKLNVKNFDLSGTTFDYKSRKDIKLSLLGSYQPRNASVVLDALDNLSCIGLHVSEEAIRDGLLRAKWPARFEIIHQGPTVIFDGAHNAQGIEAAVESVKKYFGDKKVLVLSGVLRDKDYAKISHSISTIADRVFTITPDNPRALSAEEYAAEFTKLGVDAIAYESIASALAQGLNVARESKMTLLCLGSLYTYCDIIKLIEN